MDKIVRGSNRCFQIQNHEVIDVLLNRDLNLIHALSRIKEKHIFEIEEREERLKKSRRDSHV